MSEHKTYPVKAPFEILEAVLRRVDPKYAFFGVALTELLDPSVPLDRVPNELKIRLTTQKYNRLLHVLEDVSFLRSSLIREGHEKGRAYMLSSLDLSIQGTPFNLSVLACNNINMFDWCDFTFNNLLMTSGSNGMASRNGERGSLSLRVEDPTKKFGSAQFLGICIRDIIGHRLVPMCPDEYLVLTEDTTSEIRRHHVNMIATAIRMIDKGWTLCPSLTGKALLFTLYTPGASHDVCSICLDSLGPTGPSGLSGEKEKEKEVVKQEQELMKLEDTCEKDVCDSNEKNKGKEVIEIVVESVKPRTTLPLMECGCDCKSSHPKPPANQRAITLACGHAFHIDCITRLMCEDGPTSYRCPLCNQHINFDTTHPPQGQKPGLSPVRRGPRRVAPNSPPVRSRMIPITAGDDHVNHSPPMGRRTVGPRPTVPLGAEPQLGPANIRRVLTNDYRAERLLHHNRHNHSNSSSESDEPLGVISDEDDIEDEE